MEKILRNSHDDIVVFIAPIKALANQAAAEIYARFGSKKYPKNQEKSIYAMDMTNYKINDPHNCQILITVATSFESLLCENNPVWQKKIKYIIYDEIQTINDPGLGAALEKIIHIAKCPILAISATIGNLDPFYDWVSSIQQSKGIKMNKIVHTERFCDLKKYVFAPKEAKQSHIVPLHEMFAYSENNLKDDNLAEEFHLLPTEIVEILEALKKICATEQQQQLFDSIQPDKFFNNVLINKNDVKNYEKFIINKLKKWSQQEEFSSNEFKLFFDQINQEANNAFQTIQNVYGNTFTTKQWSSDHIYELVKSLYENKMLPAIVFLKTCEECDRLAAKLTNHLRHLQEKELEDPKLLRKEEKHLAKILKLKKNLKDQKKKDSNELDRDDYELIEAMSSKPIVDMNKFTFLDLKHKLTDKEIEDEIHLHRHRKIPGILFEAWNRGIGVHHANFHNKFRSSVECLFRKRHLQIVFATETLSLGVNMPCRTVVMPNDSIYFNTIYYRHMIGRAGRRGFDTIGNVVFYGVPLRNIKNFISSKTANIRGTNSLNLNSIIQISAMQTYDSSALQVLKSFIHNPILKLTCPDYDPQKCKQYSFVKIQNLISRKLIDTNFNPFDYRTTNSVLLLRNENVASIVAIDLIQSDLFDNIVTRDAKTYEEIADRICLILCLFCQVKYITPKHVPIFKSAGLKIILPEIAEINEYLEMEEIKFDAFIRKFSYEEEEILEFKRGFPSFLNFPKNSYLYDYYINGKLESIVNDNQVSETRLWHGMKDLRYLMTVIDSFFASKGSIISHAYSICSRKVTERFFMIKN